MRVLCVGGGSGGHVTPVLAVINELASLHSDMEVMFVCDSAFEKQSRGLMAHAKVPVKVEVIKAGKFRRYHNTSVVRQLVDLPTIAWNIRDSFRIVAGLMQSIQLLKKFKPDIVFAKGGYVCLPMGFGAKLLNIPLVIHDSDARPGLTNTLLARFADAIATGAPTQNYPYDPSRMVYTGVPIDARFTPLTAEQQLEAKKAIGMHDPKRPLLVVTGGGLGAASINRGVTVAAPRLLAMGISIYHVTGKKHIETVRKVAHKDPNYTTVDFVYKDMHTVLGAADIVISRGSATFIQELAALAKAAIIVPAHHLGDQNKNAQVYKEAGAAVVLTDDDIVNETTLIATISRILDNEKATADMVDQFRIFARPDAARAVAKMIDSVYKHESIRETT